MEEKEFTCEHCRKTFIAARSDEECTKEMIADFGEEAAKDTHVVVCEQCYKLLAPRAHAKAIAEEHGENSVMLVVHPDGYVVGLSLHPKDTSDYAFDTQECHLEDGRFVVTRDELDQFYLENKDDGKVYVESDDVQERIK